MPLITCQLLNCDRTFLCVRRPVRLHCVAVHTLRSMKERVGLFFFLLQKSNSIRVDFSLDSDGTCIITHTHTHTVFTCNIYWNQKQAVAVHPIFWDCIKLCPRVAGQLLSGWNPGIMDRPEFVCLSVRCCWLDFNGNMWSELLKHFLIYSDWPERATVCLALCKSRTISQIPQPALSGL